MNDTNTSIEEQELSAAAPQTPERYADEDTTAPILLVAPAETEITEVVDVVEVIEVSADPHARPEPTRLDNILTIGLVALLALTVVAVVLRKAKSKKNAPAAVAAEPEVSAPVADAPTAPGAAGEVKLHNVEPKTAAMLMAIVADKLQKPINELRFISIKEVE